MQSVRELSQAFALAVPHEDAIRIRDDIAFFQAVQAVLAKRAPAGEHVGSLCKTVGRLNPAHSRPFENAACRGAGLDRRDRELSREGPGDHPNTRKGSCMTPTVFVSYSHDSEDHSNWVLQLATRLRSNGVNAVLDKWNLALGQDVAAFIEKGLSKSHRVLCICSENYVQKANGIEGGVGYEKKIMTAEIMADLNRDWVIPVIRNNRGNEKVPVFLKGSLYLDFEDDRLYEAKYEELLRSLLDEPVLPVPPLGENPFETVRQFAIQKFLPNSEKYVSPTTRGRVTFDYSNNNGRYCIGSGELMFETKWSKSSDRNIQLLSDPDSIDTVAVVKDKREIREIDDARAYDGSSRIRRPNVGQIAVLRNANGFFAAIKVISIRDDTRGSKFDEITFDYVIQTNGSPSFVGSA